MRQPIEPINRRRMLGLCQSWLAGPQKDWLASGVSDLIPRAKAQRSSDQLKQPIIIDSKPGAEGNIAAVARTLPEG